MKKNSTLGEKKMDEKKIEETFNQVTARLEEVAKTQEVANRSNERLGWVMNDPNVGIIVQLKAIAETVGKIQVTVIGQQDEINLFKQWIKDQEKRHIEEEIAKKEALIVVALKVEKDEKVKNEALIVVALAAEKASDKADKKREPLVNNLWSLAREIIFAALTGALVWFWTVNRLIQK